MEVLPVHIAVLTIADDAANADLATAQAISEKASTAGHTIVDEEIAKDNESAIRDQLVRWISEDNIDVVIVAAGVDSEAASAALAPLVHQTLPGFTDLFRWLTFQEIGASAMLSAAEAAQCQSTFVFVLPAHAAAVRAAMDKLILPQLDVHTKPKNLVTQMPRLKDAAKKLVDAAKSQPVAAPTPLPSIKLQPAPPIIAPVPEAVPTPIKMEKTEGGSGLPPKLPAHGGLARSKPPTANTIARRQDDPPTKPIDLAKLEKQIALSSQNEAQTKQVDLKAHDAKTKVVDMSAHQAKTRVVDTGRLPRVPPGADESAAESDDEEALTFRAPSTPRPKAPTGGNAIVKPIGIAKSSGGTTPGTQAPTSRELTTPSFSTPVSRSTPPTAYRTVSAPLSSRSTVLTPPSTPIVPHRSPPVQRSTPPSTPIATAAARIGTTDLCAAGSVPPPTIAPQRPQSGSVPPTLAPQRPQPASVPPTPAREEVLTPETPVIALRQTPPTSPPEVTAQTADEAATIPSRASTDEAATTPARGTAQPNAAELWARAITPGTQPPTDPADEEVLEAAPEDVVEATPDEVEPAPETDAPSPLSTLFANQPPPRKRPPTPPPMHIQALGRPVSQDALPEGDFSYPIKKSGAALLFKIVIALAVLGGGFFAVTQLMAPDEPTKTASVTPPPVEPTPPAPVPVAEVTVDAQQAAPEPVTTETPPPTNAAPTNPPPTETPPPPTNPPPTDTPPPTSHKRTPKATTKSTTEKPTTDPGTKPATESTEPTPTASGECDEVSCIMTKYERACCLRYKPTDGFTPKNVIPDSLDKAMVRAGVETVKPKIVACGEQNGAKGTVKVAVTVDDAGKVTAVSVIESPDTALGECVAGAMRKARFGKSVNGSEFNYPFVF